MFRNYFSRIISQVIRKLLYPEFVGIRSELEKINARHDDKTTDRTEPRELCALNIQALTQGIEGGFADSLADYTSATEKGTAIIVESIEGTISKQITELKVLGQERDEKQSAAIAELRSIMENNFERFFKRDSSHRARILELLDNTENNYVKLHSETKKMYATFDENMSLFNKRLDDLYKVIVKREEHSFMVNDVQKLRQDVELLKRNALNNNIS